MFSVVTLELESFCTLSKTACLLQKYLYSCEVPKRYPRHFVQKESPLLNQLKLNLRHDHNNVCTLLFPPVRDKFIFQEGNGYNPGSTHLWRDIFTMVELTINMRQMGDNTYSQVLGRIRTGQQTPDDITLLRTRLTSGIDTIEQYPFTDALRLLPLKVMVDEYNTHRLRQLVQVMLRRNILCEDELVNGARGIVVGFTWPDGQPTQPEIGQLPQNLLVKFHDPRVGRISRVSVEDDAEAVPIVNL